MDPKELARLAKIAGSGTVLFYLSFQKGRKIMKGEDTPELDLQIDLAKETFERAVNGEL
jgi:hypothetical protein